MYPLCDNRLLPRIAGFILALLVVVVAAPAAAGDESPALWLASVEAGVGPVDDELFLHLTPRLTFLRPVSRPVCDDNQDCDTMLEVSLHVPLRLALTDRDDGWLRSQDWMEVSDFFRVLRRIEYGSVREPVHIRLGELGPVHLGHGTIVHDYYNVITTDHFRPGLKGHLDYERWGAELLVNDLTGPNLMGVRGRWRPPQLYEEQTDWQKLTFGASVVGDVTAPYELAVGDDDQLVAGPGLHPVVEDTRPTAVAGIDARWDAFAGDGWSTSPFIDLNHHFGLGTGVHTGVIWNQNIGDDIRLSSRLEYRLLTGRYIPDYFDSFYEITRFRHPDYTAYADGYPGPKLRSAGGIDPTTRHGGLGRVQTRLYDRVTVAAAYADASGPTGTSFRLRASYDHDDQGRIGLFFAGFAPGERSFGATVGQLLSLDGALAALEGRYTIWGPLYAHGQLARQWRLREDGRFDNVHLFNLGVGAGTRF